MTCRKGLGLGMPKGTRLHLRFAQINVRLGLALAGGAYPRRI
jgi:hypothetical protein